jgi:drug/metabolite transporter (DMT)-like permease
LFHTKPSRKAAIAGALFVTFLWSTSWVLIEWGLEDIPALTFAGIRYVLASLFLLPFLFQPANRARIRHLTRRDWLLLAALGLIIITAAQGAQFLGLALLPTVTVSMLLNFTPIVVAALGIVTLREYPTLGQWVGVGIFLLGILIYFYPEVLPSGQLFGLMVMGVGVLANAVGGIIGRGVNRQERINPLIVTAISMCIGAVALLALGLATEPPPTLTLQGWAIIVWLALVNTAFAFTLWSHTQRTLTATESSIINGTMLAQIAFLAWLFLGESLTLQDLSGIALVALGTLLVQLNRNA